MANKPILPKGGPRPTHSTGETNPDKARALAAVAKTKTYRLSVDLDEPIYMELKARALVEKRKGVDLVRDAIRAYLDNLT